MINSKNKGSSYERKVAKELRELGFEDCATSRSENRKRDAEKVDLVHTDPLNIQCKAVENSVNYPKLLGEMPKEENTNVIFHKRNRKEYVIMPKEGFYKLLRQWKEQRNTGKTTTRSIKHSSMSPQTE